jgi:phosphoglycerate dehydrogenase-like enzyme
MKTQDFTMINNLVVGVTTVAFSKNETLIAQLQDIGFKKVHTNVNGKRFSKSELISILSKCDVAIVGLDEIDRSVLSKTTKLKAISKYGVGLNNINFEDCKKYNVDVLHTQGVNKRSVSEMTLGFMLGLARNLFLTSNLLKNGTWKKDGGMQLSGKKIGIIGVGNIGKDLISILKPFNCEILVNDIVDQKKYYKENKLLEVSKEFIFKNADFITVHIPLDNTTKNIINKKSLSTMKSSSFVINTARAGIINQEDLKWALQNKIIAGAAVDVYENEPPLDKELLLLPNLINTPHIGGNSKEAVEAMGVSAVNNILNWINKFNK